jgi:hypothetical protein
MDERDRAEMRAFCDQFKELMAREVETPPFDQEARVHIGEMIGRAAQEGRSQYAYGWLR